jgi:hypothetical protein
MSYPATVVQRNSFPMKRCRAGQLFHHCPRTTDLQSHLGMHRCHLKEPNNKCYSKFVREKINKVYHTVGGVSSAKHGRINFWLFVSSSIINVAVHISNYRDIYTQENVRDQNATVLHVWSNKSIFKNF